MKIFTSLLLFCSLVLAETYILKNDVLNGGGTKMTNPSYILRASFGQLTAGKISNASYNANIGFWNTSYFPITPPETPGWTRKVDILSINADTLKAVYDGSALTNDGEYIYAFHGNKTKRFYKYAAGKAGWTELESLGFRNKTYGIPGARISLDKAYPAAGAALCYDGDNRIYTIKGGGKREMWAYLIDAEAKSLPADTWIWVCTLPPVKGVKAGSGLVLLGGKFYLLVGSLTKIDSNNFFRYTPGGSWEILEKAPTIQPNPAATAKVWKTGSAMVVHDGTIYALRGGAKGAYWYKYEYPTWTYLNDSIPNVDTMYLKRTVTPNKWITAKKYPGAGASLTSTGSKIYAIKGYKSIDLWSYTVGAGWSTRTRDTIPQWNKKPPSNGAALNYFDGKLYLLKGNKTRQFWCYIPGGDDEAMIARTPITTPTVMTEKTTTSTKLTFEVTPNPFTKLTTIRYTVPVSGKVTLKLYNTTGRLVETLLDGHINAGSYTYKFEIRNSKFEIPAGIYFLKYETSTDAKEIKLIIE